MYLTIAVEDEWGEAKRPYEDFEILEVSNNIEDAFGKRRWNGEIVVDLSGRVICEKSFLPKGDKVIGFANIMQIIKRYDNRQRRWGKAEMSADQIVALVECLEKERIEDKNI